MKDRNQRGPWYLITGLIIGVVLGLVYAWLVQPVQYVDTAPASLRGPFKDRYRALIASAYMSNGDIVRARARLELLEDEDIYRSLAEQAQRTLAEQGTSDEARALGLLAIAIGQGVPDTSLIASTNPSAEVDTPPSSTPITTDTHTPAPTETSTPVPTSTGTSTPTSQTTTADALNAESTVEPEASPTPENDGTPTETPIPRPTDTPTLTATPTRTPGAPFELVDSERVCDQALPEPLIQVFAENASGNPASGVEVIVTWTGGEERFFTGLKPEKGMGYADFTPLANIIYTLRLGESGEPVDGLTTVTCLNHEGGTFWGAWVLEFVQP